MKENTLSVTKAIGIGIGIGVAYGLFKAYEDGRDKRLSLRLLEEENRHDQINLEREALEEQKREFDSLSDEAKEAYFQRDLDIKNKLADAEVEKMNVAHELKDKVSEMVVKDFNDKLSYRIDRIDRRVDKMEESVEDLGKRISKENTLRLRIS